MAETEAEEASEEAAEETRRRLGSSAPWRDSPRGRAHGRNLKTSATGKADDSSTRGVPKMDMLDFLGLFVIWAFFSSCAVIYTYLPKTAHDRIDAAVSKLQSVAAKPIYYLKKKKGKVEPELKDAEKLDPVINQIEDDADDALRELGLDYNNEKEMSREILKRILRQEKAIDVLLGTTGALSGMDPKTALATHVPASSTPVESMLPTDLDDA